MLPSPAPPTPPAFRSSPTDPAPGAAMYRWLLPLTFLLPVPLPSFAQTPPAPKADAAAELRDYVRANYTKYEYLIPTRDGVKLFTSVYVPKDDAQTYPILMTRTPYSCQPYGVDKYPNTLG